MAKNTFKLKTPKQPNSLVLINYNVCKDRLVLSTAINVPTKIWNAKKNRLKPIIDPYPIAEVNKRLDHIDNYVNAQAILLKMENRLSKNNLKLAVETFFDRKKGLELLPWLECYIDDIMAGNRLTDKKRKWEAGSIKTIVTTYNILKQYNAGLTWGDMNMEFFDKFLNWCTYIKQYKPSNITRHFKRLKTLLNVAAEEGACKNLDYKKWKIGSEEKFEGAIALTQAELDALAMVELPAGLSKWRDLFLVGCYTGQRFGDYSTIERGDIQDGVLAVIQEKTKTMVKIKLDPNLKSILARYEVLPRVSNQNFNKYIKQVCEHVGALHKTEKFGYTKAGHYHEVSKPRWAMVSSHTARRTFATLAYERDTPIYAIMTITGHKTEKSFMAYIKTSKEMQAEIFSRYNK